MNENHNNIPLLVTLCFTLAIAGMLISYANGATQGYNDGITHCIENPKVCLIEYQYLKLKENQK